MEEDIRYKLLKELSLKNKLSTNFSLKTQFTKEDLNELINEKLVIHQIHLGKVNEQFFRITMKGRMYLNEYEKLMKENTFYYRNKDWMLIVIGVLISGLISILTKVVEVKWLEQPSNQKIYIHYKATDSTCD